MCPSGLMSARPSHRSHYVSVWFDVCASVHGSRTLLTYILKITIEVFIRLTTLMHFGTDVNTSDFGIKI